MAKIQIDEKEWKTFMYSLDTVHFFLSDYPKNLIAPSRAADSLQRMTAGMEDLLKGSLDRIKKHIETVD